MKRTRDDTISIISKLKLKADNAATSVEEREIINEKILNLKQEYSITDEDIIPEFESIEYMFEEVSILRWQQALASSLGEIFNCDILSINKKLNNDIVYLGIIIIGIKEFIDEFIKTYEEYNLLLKKQLQYFENSALYVRACGIRLFKNSKRHNNVSDSYAFGMTIALYSRLMLLKMKAFINNIDETANFKEDYISKELVITNYDLEEDKVKRQNFINKTYKEPINSNDANTINKDILILGKNYINTLIISEYAVENICNLLKDRKQRNNKRNKYR